MKIYKRDGVYYVRFQHRGRNINRSTKSGNKRDAEQIAKRIHREIVLGTMLPDRKGSKLTLAELKDAHIKRREDRLARENRAYLSLGADKARWAHVLSYFGEDTIAAKITDEEWLRFFAHYATTPSERTGKPPSPATRNRLRALLHAAFAENIDPPNPISEIKLARETLTPEVKAKRHHLFTVEEWERFCAECPNRKMVLAFTVCFWCGVRLGVIGRKQRADGQLRGLPWSWVDLEAGWIELPDGHTKTSEGRSVPIPPPALEALRAWRAEHPNDEEVLDVRTDSLKSTFSKWRKRLGLRGTFHASRHTALTRYAALGAGEAELQMIGGHLSREMLQRYVQTAKDRLSELANQAGTTKKKRRKKKRGGKS